MYQGLPLVVEQQLARQRQIAIQRRENGENRLREFLQQFRHDRQVFEDHDADENDADSDSDHYSSDDDEDAIKKIVHFDVDDAICNLCQTFYDVHKVKQVQFAHTVEKVYCGKCIAKNSKKWMKKTVKAAADSSGQYDIQTTESFKCAGNVNEEYTIGAKIHQPENDWC